MIRDHHRPSYHHLPAEGLLWDPCAAVFRDGRYHLFYLHDSWAAAGPSRRSDGYNYKAWAHVSGTDLVHWERHPDALARGQTGNLFTWNGAPAIVFPHPDGGGASCFAGNPEGDLERWRFDPRGAVLRHPVQGDSLYPSSNDVTAWQEGERCYLLTGTRDPRRGGDTLHLFRSRNPLAPAARAGGGSGAAAGSGTGADWEYLHQFYRSRREWTAAGDDCSCPDFFRIGPEEAATWMLLHFCHNAPGGSRYYLGSYRDRRFEPRSFHRINWPGGNLHAPRTLLDGQGRRIMFANLNERRPPEELVAAGWSGCLSLPVELTLDPAGECVRFAPVTELQALRRRVSARTEVALAPAPNVRDPAGSATGALADATPAARPPTAATAAPAPGLPTPPAPGLPAPITPATGPPTAEVEVPLPEVSGDALEIELQVTAGSAAACGVKVRCSPDGAEETVVALNAATRAVEIDFGKATLRTDLAFARWDAKLARPVQSAPLQFDPARPVTLRVFVDHSVVEVFAGAGAGAGPFERYLAQRVYPTRPDALGVKLFSRGGRAVAHRIRTWPLRPA